MGKWRNAGPGEWPLLEGEGERVRADRPECRVQAMRRWIEVLFLRFYAANLTRRRRAEPATACRDAITQLGVVGCLVILICTAMTVWRVARYGLQHLYDPDGLFVGVVIVPAVAFMLWANRAFSKYADRPHAADPYTSPSAVRLTNILYIAIPLSGVVLLGVTLRLVEPGGSP